MDEQVAGLFKRREPLHRVVAAEFRRRIHSGAWETDALIPSEDALASELMVGRSTIREALRGLEQEGLIIRRQGIGSFVSAHANQIMGNLSALESFMDTIAQAGQTPRMETVHLSLGQVPDDVARDLGLADGEEAWLVKNLYYADDVVAILTEAIIPVAVLPAESEAAAKIHHVPLRVFLRTQCKIDVIGGVLTVEAVGAPEGVSRIMGVRKDHAFLKLSGNAVDASGAPVYYMRSYINTNVYRFSVLRR